MSMAANKHRGIRAAACSDTFSARLTRVHNNANVLCFGERVVGMGLALDLVDAFVDAEFEGGKHQRRVDMITQIEISESNA
jgi:ribose 5-phosphate isomerase B